MTSWYMTETVPFTGKRLAVDVDGIPVRDRYGNDVYTKVTFNVPNCAVEPRTSVSSEDNDRQQHVVSGLNVFCANPDVDVWATDEATWGGLTYQVVGQVGRFKGARMPENNHAYIVLERVSG